MVRPVCKRALCGAEDETGQCVIFELEDGACALANIRTVAVEFGILPGSAAAHMPYTRFKRANALSEELIRQAKRMIEASDVYEGLPPQKLNWLRQKLLKDFPEDDPDAVCT